VDVPSIGIEEVLGSEEWSRWSLVFEAVHPLKSPTCLVREIVSPKSATFVANQATRQGHTGGASS
jgi:hypothetical protein